MGIIFLLLCVDPSAPTVAKPVFVTEVHDADTVKGVIDLGFGISYVPKMGIRAAGYDAWEVSRVRQTVVITDDELVKGKVARDKLKALLVKGKLYIEQGDTDPYGRVNAIFWVLSEDGKWIFLAKWMEDNQCLRSPR